MLLARELFAESNFPACRLECQRQLQEFPADAEARLLKALAERRMGLDSSVVLRSLAEDPAVPPEIGLRACYAWARSQWCAGDWRGAFACFHRVFNETKETALSIRAGCALSQLLRQHPELAREYPELRPQAETLRALFSREIISECRMPFSDIRPKPAEAALTDGQTPGAWSGRPGAWIIAFYQRQIRPALGERCSLSPSCSEYAREAFHKHGLLGFALAADRLFREPSVVAAAAKPIKLDGKLLYEDPLSAHDWWLGE